MSYLFLKKSRRGASVFRFVAFSTPLQKCDFFVLLLVEHTCFLERRPPCI